MKPDTVLRAACAGLTVALAACTSSSGSVAAPVDGPVGLRPVAAFDAEEGDVRAVLRAVAGRQASSFIPHGDA